jgi:hypothetical protein
MDRVLVERIAPATKSVGGGAAAGEHDGEDGASTTRTKAREGWSAATRAWMNE